jgi:hypothetical protein
MVKVAIYARDVKDEQFADLRAWVEAKGFTDIVEYRDVAPLGDIFIEKELGRLLDGVMNREFKFVFVISLKQLGTTYPQNVFLMICTLRGYGIRLISREEEWTDLSAQDLGLVYLAYSRHLDSEREMSNRSRTRRTRPKNDNKPKGDRDSDKGKRIGVHRRQGTSDGILKIIEWFRSHLINKRS